MPNNFTGVLSGPQNPTASKESYIGSASDIGQSISEIAKVGGELQDQRILSKYQSDLLANSGDKNAYNGALRDLNQKLYDASSRNDKAAMTEYMTQLEKLRRGEMSGIMSPTASSLRIQMLTKEWANRYPHLASQFKAIYNEQGVGGYGGGAEEEDPIQKGMNDVLQESMKTGKTVAEIWEQKELADEVEVLTNRLKIKQLQGENTKPELERVANATLRAAIMDIPNALTQEARAGNLDGANWAIQLENAKVVLGGKLEDIFAEHERTGVVLGREWKDSVIQQQMKVMDGLISAAKAADSSDKAARLAKNAQEVRGSELEKFLIEMYGYNGAIMVKYPAAVELAKDLITAQRALSKSGGSKALFEALADSDPRAAGVAALLGDGVLERLVLRNLGFVLSGGAENKEGNPDPLAGLSPLARRTVVGSLERAVQKPGMQPEDYAGMVVRMASEIPDKLASNQAALSHIRNIPGLRDKVMQVFANTLTGMADQMDPADFDDIEMAGSGASGAPVQTKNKEMEQEAGMMAGTGSEAAAFAYPARAVSETDATSQMAALLNSYYSVLVNGGLSPEEAKQQVGKGLSAVIQMRVEQGQRPTRAQAAEAEQKNLVDAQKGENELEQATSLVISAVQAGKLPAKLASEFLKEFQGVDSPKLDRLEPGVYRDKATGVLWSIAKDGLMSRVEK